MQRVSIFALLIATLGGCAKIDDYYDRHIRPAPEAKPVQIEKEADRAPPVKVRSEPSAAEEALAYLAFFRQLPDAEQQIELARLRDSLQSDGTADDRVRLALILAQPGNSFADQKKSLKLIAAYLKDSSEDPAEQGLGELVRLMSGLLSRQQELQQQLREEKDRSEALAQQLNDLRDIENIIRQRELNGLPGR